jgi:hypothetical protein
MNNINVNWLIEDVDIMTDIKKLIPALQSTNTNYIITSCENSLNHFSDNDCVIAYGSLHFINHIKKYAKFIPGIWIDFDSLQCHKYLTYLHEFSIHKKYGFHTIEQIINDKNIIYEMYNNKWKNDEQKIFIKPNVGWKMFSGDVMHESLFESDFASQVNHLDKTTLCLVSEVSDYNIEKEFRFYVSSKEIITGTQYKPEINSYTPNDIYDFVNKIKDKYFTNNKDLKYIYPFPIIIDVGLLTTGEYKLIELGGFNCAGLYDCDYEKLVITLNSYAINEYNEFNNI